MAKTSTVPALEGQDSLSADDKAAIRVQLDRIVKDKLFRDTTRMKRFLQYVTEETIEGRGDRLKGYVIGLEVFDRPSDFDPQTDTIVRVQAGQLRRRLDLYYAESGELDPVRLTIPKGQYAPKFEFRRNKLEANVTDLIKLVETNPEFVLPGLGVKTLDDHTHGQSSDFFAEGLTSEIVSALVQFRHIRVITVNSAVSELSHPDDEAGLMDQYEVQFVLSGSVRQAGDLFRVSVTLTARDTGQILYSATFDRRYSADTIFEVQESIASNVAAAVAAPFGQINRYDRRSNKGRRSSLTAYEAVLRFYEMGLAPSLPKARALLQDIERLTGDFDDFSTGYAIRAMLHTMLCTQCIPPGDGPKNLRKAKELAERARRIDPQNSMAWFASFQAAYHSGELEEANTFALRAIERNQNDYSMLAYFAITRAHQGDRETAEAYDKSARRLIANPPPWFYVPSLTIKCMDGDFDAVSDMLDDIGPSDTVSFWFMKLMALGWLGETEKAEHLLSELAEKGQANGEDWVRTFNFWQTKPELKAPVFEGWRRAGLDIPDQ